MTLALLLLAAAPPAGADYDPLGSGTVAIRLDKRFAAFLDRNRIELEAGSPAKLASRRIVLPIGGGKVDPTIGRGTIETEGAIVFRGRGRRVPLRRIAARANRNPLIAKVGGSQLKVATTRRLKAARSGFGVRVKARDLRLTAKVATRLTKKLRPATPFRAGQRLGTLVANAQPETVNLVPQGRAYVLLGAGMLSKLDSLFVSLAPIAPAELAPGPLFTFPILANGAIALDASLGRMRVGGQLEFLQLGGGQAFWDEGWFEFGTRTASAEANTQPSPPYGGELGRVGILGLGGVGTVLARPEQRTIALSGEPLVLQPGIAAEFNQVFAEGRPVFAPGELFGYLAFAATGQ